MLLVNVIRFRLHIKFCWAFILEKVCAMDYFRPTNIVPIIVGICLALLVIGVLVAYLIGRRRNHNGYQSV